VAVPVPFDPGDAGDEAVPFIALHGAVVVAGGIVGFGVEALVKMRGVDALWPFDSMTSSSQVLLPVWLTYGGQG